MRLRGPLGSPKSLILTGYMVHASKQLEEGQRLLWLTRTRKQHTKAVRTLRQFLKDPRLAIALGRPDGSTAENGEEWDSVVADFVQGRVSQIVDGLKNKTRAFRFSDATYAWDSGGPALEVSVGSHAQTWFAVARSCARSF